jgi:hypothetical protein
MKKIILFLLFSINLGFSQEMLNSIPITLKGDRDVFHIVNEEKHETILFLSDKRTVTAFRLNDKMIISDSISAERPEKKYSDIIGYGGDKSNPVIYWASSNHKEVYSQDYDFTNHRISVNAFNLSLDGEEFLQYFSEGDRFYMLTTVLNSSILKLYVFRNDRVEPKTIDLSELKIVNEDSKSGDFSASLKKEFKFGGFFNLKKELKLEKIEPEILTPLTESSNKIKCYTNPESIIITSDENVKFTQLIRIDLESGKPELKIFKQKNIAGDDVNSNSFLIDEKLFQITLDANKIFVMVKNPDDKIISEYSAAESEPITFKNSDVVRQSSYSGSKRVLEKTSQFLKKINNSKCAISSYKLNGNYLLTIGSVSNERANGGGMGMMPMGGMGFGGGSPRFVMSFSPIYFNNASNYFDSYANRKVVYLNSLLNSDAKHIDGEVPELAFDKMKKFIERFYDFTAQTVYKINGAYYLGYYNKMTKQYVIRQFSE